LGTLAWCLFPRVNIKDVTTSHLVGLVKGLHVPVDAVSPFPHYRPQHSCAWMGALGREQWDCASFIWSHSQGNEIIREADVKSTRAPFSSLPFHCSHLEVEKWARDNRPWSNEPTLPHTSP